MEEQEDNENNENPEARFERGLKAPERACKEICSKPMGPPILLAQKLAERCPRKR